MATKRSGRRRRAPALKPELWRDPESGVMISPKGGDRGPAERYQHGDEVTIEGGSEPHVRIQTQTMLDRYWQRRNIDARQYHAGRRLYRQWRAAGSEHRLVAGYDGQFTSSHEKSTFRREESEMQADQRVAFMKAIRAVGKQLNEVVIHVCLVDGSASDWAAGKLLPRNDGIARLRAGLDALGDHYGMPGAGQKS